MPQMTFSLPKDRTLHFPVQAGDYDSFYYVSVTATATGEKKHEFYFGLTPDAPAFYTPYVVEEDCGEEITLACFDADAPDNLFDGVIVGGSPFERPDLYPDLYHEPKRQQIHYSPMRGWMNDPNGLVYTSHDSTFHMGYQHNPFGENHGCVNVSWGMATSQDGVHFTQSRDCLMPWDSLTHIASGSAVSDTDNVLGYGSDAFIAVFTGLRTWLQKKGRKELGTRGQYLAVSTDGGKTYRRPAPFDRPIISVPQGENWRDPKILKLEDGSFCVAVYEVRGEDGVSFYASRDLIHWEFKTFTNALWECPDLFRIRCADTGEYFWVLYGNNNRYRIGTFDHYVFTETQPGGLMDYGFNARAGQTYNNTPRDDERFHMAYISDDDMSWDWEKDSMHGVGFSQSMSLLCRFTLRKTPKGYRLFRAPVDAVSTLREGPGETFSVTDTETRVLASPGDTELTFNTAVPFTLTVNQVTLTWDTRVLTLSKGDRSHEYEPAYGKDTMDVRIVCDTNSAEIFVNGEISATNCVTGQKTLTVCGECRGRTWRMRSIWDK